MEEINDLNYKSWHETYVRCTTEKEKVEKALTRIINKLPHRRSFLDVGAGDGDLTFRICHHFQNSVVIEPNKMVKEVFERKGVKFINGYFEEINTENQLFDFILCSQVFWLVKRENQISFIKKMYSSLSQGGKIAIIMVSPLGQSHDFYKKFFYGYNTTTHEILKDLHALGIQSEVIPISFDFRSESFEDFFNICKLFTLESWLHPVNISDSQITRDIGDVRIYTEKKLGEIDDFIKSNCFSGNEYIMNEEIDIIVLTKEFV